jgi:tetraprenyl-beta-curcumene synthase
MSSSRPALLALAVANARFWPTVAPGVRRELARWQVHVQQMPDARDRSLALEKLREERFNSEVAATLATLAPRTTRPAAVEAIVALELLFDYLDRRTEILSADPIEDSRRLFASFLAIVPEAAGRAEPGRTSDETAQDDEAYPRALAMKTRARLAELPSHARVAATMSAAALRCSQAQTYLHAAPVIGHDQLREWAELGAVESGLGWREYAAGSASSVLSLHALIAAAARPGTTATLAARIDHAYLAIGALITLLDSVVDESRDLAIGQPGFISLYGSPAELRESFQTLLSEALARLREAPDSAHHEMTLAGIVAYYTTHPGARAAGAQAIVNGARRALSPTIWPTLAVMRGWRVAKSARAALQHGRNSETDTRGTAVYLQ